MIHAKSKMLPYNTLFFLRSLSTIHRYGKNPDRPAGLPDPGAPTLGSPAKSNAAVLLAQSRHANIRPEKHLHPDRAYNYSHHKTYFTEKPRPIALKQTSFWPEEPSTIAEKSGVENCPSFYALIESQSHRQT